MWTYYPVDPLHPSVVLARNWMDHSGPPPVSRSKRKLLIRTDGERHPRRGTGPDPADGVGTPAKDAEKTLGSPN